MDFVIAQPRATEACQMAFSLQPFLSPALEESRGEITLQELFGLILREEAKVWLVFELESRKLRGVAVTQETEYPHYTNLRVTFMGGLGMADWQDALDCALCSYARERELSNIEIVGRKGFTKVLKPLGYEPVYTVLVKEVYCG